MSHLPECDKFTGGSPLGCICSYLREAEQRGRESSYLAYRPTQIMGPAGERRIVQGGGLAGYNEGYEQGQRDAIAKAVSAVEALYVPGWPPTNDQVIAAIKAVGDE